MNSNYATNNNRKTDNRYNIDNHVDYEKFHRLVTIAENLLRLGYTKEQITEAVNNINK